MSTPGGPADDDALHRDPHVGMSLELRAGDPTFTCDACGTTDTLAGVWRTAAIDTWAGQHQAPRLVSWTIRVGNQVVDTVTAAPPHTGEGRVWPPPPPAP